MSQPRQASPTTSFPLPVVATVLSIICSGVTVEIFRWIRKKKGYIEAANRLPGPSLKGHSPWLAHIDSYVKTMKTIPGFPDVPRSIDVISKYVAEFGKDGIFRLWLFNPYRLPFANCAVFLTDPSMVRQLLLDKKNTTKMVKQKRPYKLAGPIIGDSFLALPDGPVWKHQRKLVARGFNQDFLELVNEVGNEVLYNKVFKSFDHQLTSNSNLTVDMVELSTRITSEILGQVAFSYSFGCFVDESASDTEKSRARALFEAYQYVLLVIANRNRAPPLLHHLAFEENRMFNDKIKFLDSIVDQVMKERIDEQLKTEHNQKTNGVRKRRDLLSYMIDDDSELRMTIQQLRDNIKMFMFAGQDTTASALSFTIWELAIHPEEQAQLRAEVDSLFENAPEGKQPTYKDIMNLKFLDAVIRESLRLYSAVVVGRTTVKDITLSSSTGKQFVVPENSSVFIFPFLNQREEACRVGRMSHWMPKRFLGSGDANLHKNWMPFSVGPRSCVGQPMAMAELKQIVCHTVRKYSIRPSPERKEDPIPIINLVLRPHSMHVELTKRFIG